MPDVTPNKAFKSDDYSRDHSGIGPHCVFPTRLVRIGRHGCTCVLQDAFVFVEERFEATTVEDLESNQVQMDRMRVICQINQVPDFHRVQDGILGDRHIPVSTIEQHRDWILGSVIDFDERQHARFCGFGFRNPWHGTQRRWQ